MINFQFQEVLPVTSWWHPSRCFIRGRGLIACGCGVYRPGGLISGWRYNGSRANITNMGLIGTFGGYYLYRTIRYALGRNTGGE